MTNVNGALQLRCYDTDEWLDATGSMPCRNVKSLFSRCAPARSCWCIAVISVALHLYGGSGAGVSRK